MLRTLLKSWTWYKPGIVKDNISDIIIYPFENTNPGTGEKAPNFCSFTNAQFINKTICLSEPYVNLWGVDGIKFRGCFFINELNKSDCMLGYNKGTGIRSFSSGFYVDDYCVNNTVPCDETKQCHFENLEYGIYAFNGELSKYISIDTAVFVNNKTGVYMSMVENQTITQNKFDYDDTHDLYNYNNGPVGLYLETCTGYTVEENLYNSSVQDVEVIGIQILNSGSAYNEIYNNTFENIACGISAAGENRAETGEGLCLKCNDFVDCITDIFVTPEYYNGNPIIGPTIGIAEKQGEMNEEGNDPTLAAGNTFTEDNTEPNYNNDPNCTSIIYTYHQESSTEKKIRPHPVTDNVTRQEDQAASYSKETSCASNLNGNGIDESAEKSILMMEYTEIRAYEDTLIMLTDGGDTDGLNSDIQFSLPNEAMQLRQQLMSESPYLSDTAMKSAIYKENVLPNVMIRDILVANPQMAKTPDVIQSLDNRFDPMPDYMMAEIMTGQNFVGAKEIIEHKLSSHKSKRYLSLSKLERYYKNDTLNISTSTDSLIALWKREPYPGSKYKLSFQYLNKEDSLVVFNTLDSVLLEFNLTTEDQNIHQQYVDLFDILIQLQCDTITLDSIMIQSLLSLSTQKSRPGIYARNILINDSIISYFEPVYLPDLLKSVPVWDFKPPRKDEDLIMKIFPNPAGNYFIIEYNLSEFDGHSIIVISDMNGKLFTLFELKNSHTQIVLSSEKFPNGTYLIQLLLNNKLKEATKITIVK